MDAKEYLEQIGRLDEAINCRMRELTYWRHKATSLSGMKSDGMPHSPNRPIEAGFVRYVEKADEIERNIDRMIDELADLRKEAGAAIDAMGNGKEQILLRCRYLDCLSWADICTIMNVSHRTVHRLHDAALQEFHVPE